MTDLFAVEKKTIPLKKHPWKIRERKHHAITKGLWILTTGFFFDLKEFLFAKFSQVAKLPDSVNTESLPTSTKQDETKLL